MALVSAGEGDLDSSIEHIGEAQTTEALVVAPATANVLAKFAHGLADDFLTTLFLATRAPVIVAPAMNVNMWEHPATRANMEILEGRGVRIVPPDKGPLACGMIGSGRLAEPEAIVEAVLGQLHGRNDLAGETVLVTAAGTREAIDPVRFLGQSLQRENGLCGGRGGAAPGGAGGVGEWPFGAPAACQLRAGFCGQRGGYAPRRS